MDRTKLKMTLESLAQWAACTLVGVVLFPVGLVAYRSITANQEISDRDYLDVEHAVYFQPELAELVDSAFADGKVTKREYREIEAKRSASIRAGFDDKGRRFKAARTMSGNPVFARSDFKLSLGHVPFEFEPAAEPWGATIIARVTKESFGGKMPEAFDIRCYLLCTTLEGKLELDERHTWLYKIGQGGHKEFVKNGPHLAFSSDASGYYTGFRHPTPEADGTYEMVLRIVAVEGANIPKLLDLDKLFFQVRVAVLKDADLSL